MARYVLTVDTDDESGGTFRWNTTGLETMRDREVMTAVILRILECCRQEKVRSDFDRLGGGDGSIH